MDNKVNFQLWKSWKSDPHRMIKMIAEMKIKAEWSTDDVIIEWYASTVDKDRGNDIVNPKAFNIAQAKSVVMLYNHDPYIVIGKTIDAIPDQKWLFIKWKITSNQLEVKDNIRNWNLTKMSIGFIPTEFSFKDDGGMIIDAVDLLEISVVSTPMNEQAEFSVSKQLKSFKNLIQSEMDLKTLDEIAAEKVEAAEVEETTEEVVEEAVTEEVKAEETTECIWEAKCEWECTKEVEEEVVAEEASEEVEATDEVVVEETTEAPAEVETKSLKDWKVMSMIKSLSDDLNEKTEIIAKQNQAIAALSERLREVTQAVANIPVNAAWKKFNVGKSSFAEAFDEALAKAEWVKVNY